jgi:hypothetical protein
MTQTKRIPIAVKLLFTAFMAVLVPVYWKNYGLTNFLYFCDVALFLTLAAVWLESPLLAAMSAVGIVLPQLFWCADFIATAIGLPITGMTAYMFDSKIPLFARGLSFFHFWLPFLLIYLVWRLGYDRRALKYWTVLAWALLLICYFISPAPPSVDPNVPANINYVYGLSDAAPQTWMPRHLWLLVLMIGLPLLLYWPTHLALLRAFPPRGRSERLRPLRFSRR